MSFEVAETIKNNPGSSIVLTRREKEVLKLIADGMTNNEIAQTLFISATTIDTHRKNLLEKFEAKNTALLIRMATQMQII